MRLDDIVKYLGPSLERHRGCDLVDINPGAGVWSRTLHNFLEPRKHLMLEKDADLYQPFLSDLLAKDNVELVPKSGIVWKDLNEILRANLPNQVEVKRGSVPQRNDTLLVNVNLSFFPQKTFQLFDCVSTMVLYQFMSSIRTMALFQKYGLVRMLIWVNDDGKKKLIPRSITRRKRSAFEAELSCDWIHEVAGKEAELQNRYELRDDWINIESNYNVLERMQQQGMTMPTGRETRSYIETLADPSLAGQKLAGMRPPVLARPFKQELEELEAILQVGHMTPTENTRLKDLRQRDRNERGEAIKYLELLQQREGMLNLAASSPVDFARANQAWNEHLAGWKKNPHNTFTLWRDNYHIFRQDPPVLLWDQRKYEPLAVKADEFFPNAPSALLDFQPKTMHPLLRQHGPNTSRAGDMSEVMLRYWFTHSTLPVSKAMDGMWPGFGDLLDRCPSFKDLAHGGMPMTGLGELTARAINEAQWAEVLQAWMDWPFRPTYPQLVGRLVDDTDTDGEDEEHKSGALGLSLTG